MGVESALKKLRQKNTHQVVLLAQSMWPRFLSRVYYPRVFHSFGSGSVLGRPAVLAHPEFISIGAATRIRSGCRLEALPVTSRTPHLSIGNDVNLEQNVHIVCHHRVTIGDRVSITANCSIVDTTHPFDNMRESQKVGSLVSDDDGFVEIGEGSFLGIGCVVLPFVRIGKHCVIGANSVVTRDIPDFSVAAGSPAKVLRSITKLD